MNTKPHPEDHYPKTVAEADALASAGVPLTKIRTPDGAINNCALAAGECEDECQICNGHCPDREALT